MNFCKSLLLVAVAFAGCHNDTYRKYYFVGRVYDGATGERLTKYKLDLQYFNHRVSAQVAGDGRYFVGPLSALNDYTIEITAAGYRSFMSHNEMKFLEWPYVSDGESFYFDAYLFPENLLSPAATLNVRMADSSDLPSGTIRFRATGGSALDNAMIGDNAVDMPAGVLKQVWGNDEDIQFRTVVKTFTDGVVDLAEGELVYGVKYAVNISGVAGHQNFTSDQGSYQPGIDGFASFVVKPLHNTDLAITFKNTDLGVPVLSGDLVIFFNQPVELDPTVSTAEYIDLLDNDLSITTYDTNANGLKNTLKMHVAGTNVRGIKLIADGEKITIGWGGAAALDIQDAGDDLTVNYVSLDKVRVKAKDGPASSSHPLSDLLGMPGTSVTTSSVVVRGQSN